MRQYVWVAPWWPSLSCTSMITVYLHYFGMTRAKILWLESMTCLYSNPLLCRKRSTSCFSTFPFDSCLEMWLQNGSFLCICSSACNLSSVSGFGMVSGVSMILVMSGIVVSVLGCGVRFSVMLLCVVLLLVWNVDPSRLVADSIWTIHLPVF